MDDLTMVIAAAVGAVLAVYFAADCFSKRQPVMGLFFVACLLGLILGL